MPSALFTHPARGFDAEPGILWSPRTGPWLVLAVEPLHYDGIPVSDMYSSLRAFQSMVQRVGHGAMRLFVVNEPAALPGRATSDGRQAWLDYEAGTHQFVMEQGFMERRCYVAISLTRTRIGPISTWLRRLWSMTGLAAATSGATDDQNNYRDAADVLLASLAQTGCVVTPASPEAISRLVARPYWMDLDPSAATVSGTVRAFPDEVLLMQPDQRQLWVAHLLAADTQLAPFPMGAWLLPRHRLDFEPTVSCWVDVVAADVQAQILERMHEVTADQVRNITGGGEYDDDPKVSLRLSEQLDTTRLLAHSVRQTGQPWTWWQATVTVTAPDARQLGKRVSETVSSFAEDGVTLLRPKWIQGQLNSQSQLGAPRRVRDRRFTRKTPAVTFAAGMPHASVRLGMDGGPYLGHTTNLAQTPVYLDLLALAPNNQATTVVVTGSQGAGKSATAKKLAAEARMRGAWVLIMDPSREYGPMADLPGMGKVNLVALGNQTPGILNPTRVHHDPVVAARFAVELAMIMLAPGTNVETHLTAIAKREMARAGASMRTFVEAVAGHLDPDVSAAGHALLSYADDPLASLFFGDTIGADPLRVDDALTLLQWDGLDLPNVAMERGEWTAGNRLSAAVLHGTVALADRLMDRTRRDTPKLWVMDEAHQFTTTASGARLVMTGNTSGRKEDMVLMLVTQNPSGLTRFMNNVSVALCGRTSSDEERLATCRALGRAYQDPDTQVWHGDPDIMDRIRGLNEGEFLMRDHIGRVGRVQVDHTDDLLWAAADTTPKGPREMDATSV